MIVIAVFAALLVTAPAAAPARTIAVVQARVAGRVGERFDGYLGMVAAPGDAALIRQVTAPGDAALASQVAAINIRRRALYSGLADSRGVSLEEVGITAACQLLATVAVGEQYMLGDHVWRARVAGQDMLVPDYCR